MRFTIITCTGDRPEAFALCEKYVARQTLAPVQWIVMDDGTVPTVCTMGQEYHYVPQMQGRGSLVKKLRMVLENIPIAGDTLAFFEDDDWYSPDWLEFLANSFRSRGGQIIGEGRALYYSVRGRFWFEHSNLQHASLCSTALNHSVFPALLAECQKSEVPFIDVALWARREFSRNIFDPLLQAPKKRHVIGIKAMPGRVGYGTGHRARERGAHDDSGLEFLSKLIGDDDANAYAPFRRVEPESLLPLPARPAVSHSITGQVRGPNWINWLSHLRGQPKIRGLEIGTFEGESAEFMLDNIFTHSSSRYFCVDPFTGSTDHHANGVDVSNIEARARARLKRFANVEIVKGYSNEVLRRQHEPLHALYVDGAHDAMNTLRDSVLGFELLTTGGIMIWDDNDWAAMPNEIERPKMAINAFIACYGREIEIIQRTGWQVCIRKK